MSFDKVNLHGVNDSCKTKHTKRLKVGQRSVYNILTRAGNDKSWNNTPLHLALNYTCIPLFSHL